VTPERGPATVVDVERSRTGDGESDPGPAEGTPEPEAQVTGSRTRDQIDAERQELDARILALHRAGASYRDVVAALARTGTEITIARAHRGVQRAIAAEPVSDSAAIRSTLLSQIDDAYRLLRSIAHAVDDDGGLANRDRTIRAIEKMVPLWDRKAKLLGLDAPARRVVEIEVVTDGALRSEREMLSDFLASAGIDVSALPTPQDRAAEMLALSSSPGPIDATAAEGDP